MTAGRKVNGAEIAEDTLISRWILSILSFHTENTKLLCLGGHHAVCILSGERLLVSRNAALNFRVTTVKIAIIIYPHLFFFVIELFILSEI